MDSVAELTLLNFKYKNMITAFELKNRPCCRFFYKIPYFIKNLVLLAVMFVIIGLNYLVHYQMGELTV
jgi:hypothetical protein